MEAVSLLESVFFQLTQPFKTDFGYRLGYFSLTLGPLLIPPTPQSCAPSY